MTKFPLLMQHLREKDILLDPKDSFVNDQGKTIYNIPKSIAQLTLGQALFELQRFNESRDVFTNASKSKKDAVKKSARAWLKYTDNEQERVRNLNLRKESIS